MERYLIIIGLLINVAYMLINRFIYKLPDWAAIPVLLLGIGLILTGAYLKNM